MRYVFIINPASGKNSAGDKIFPQVEAYFEAHAIPYTVHHTTHSGHATELTRAEGQKGDEVRVIAVGGDGTLCEVANGAEGMPNVTVGVLPCGSGNDFIKLFGSKEDFLDVERMVNGTVYAVDMIANDGIHSINICCAGIDAAVALDMVNYKRIPFVSGPMAYNIALVRAFLGRIGNKVRIFVDDEEVANGRYLLSAVANGRCYGGGYYASPKSLINDGVLDIILIRKPITRFQIPLLLSIYKRGEHIGHPRFAKLLQEFHGKKVRIEAEKPIAFTADGECAVRDRIELELLPKAIRFLVPQNCKVDCLLQETVQI